MAKKKCSDIGNIGNKSTDTDIVILGPIYRYADIGASLIVQHTFLGTVKLIGSQIGLVLWILYILATSLWFTSQPLFGMNAAPF